MNEQKQKPERDTRWYKAHTDDYTRTEAQQFLDWCESQKIPELAAVGFIEIIRRAMMAGTGQLTAREIRNLASKSVFDVVSSPDAWQEWLEMAVRFHVLETVQEANEGETFVFYTDPDVQTAYKRVAELAENGQKGGRKRAENAKIQAEKQAEKRERERARYRKNKAQKALAENGQAPLEAPLEQIKD